MRVSKFITPAHLRVDSKMVRFVFLLAVVLPLTLSFRASTDAWSRDVANPSQTLQWQSHNPPTQSSKHRVSPVVPAEGEESEDEKNIVRIPRNTPEGDLLLQFSKLRNVTLRPRITIGRQVSRVVTDGRGRVRPSPVRSD